MLFVFFSHFIIAITSLGEESESWCFSCVCLICACLVLSVSWFFVCWCLGGAAVCDCGTPWTFLLPFLVLIVLFVAY